MAITTGTLIIIILLVFIFVLLLWPFLAAASLKKKGKLIIKA